MPSMSNQKSLRGSRLALVAAILGWMFDGLEMGIFPLVAGPGLRSMGVQAGLEAGSPLLSDFVSQWMGWITASFLFGAAAGGLLFGWLGDRIGRVRAMSWSILFYSLFTGLCYFAVEPWHFSALRFLAALGMGGEWALGVALVMETWPERWRPWLAGVIGASANFGYVLIACIAIMVPIQDASWRWVMLVGAFPAVLTLLIRLFVPESEKWQSAIAKQPTSLRQLGKPPQLQRLLFAILFASIALIVTWGTVQWIPLWADEMVGSKDPVRKAIIQFCSACGAVLGSGLAPLLGGWLGRRACYFLLCFSSIVCCEWLFLGMSDFGNLFLFVTFLVGMTTASFYGWLPLYLPELFPTAVRATGQGIAFNFGRILAGVGALSMPQIMHLFGNSYPTAGATIVLIYLVGMVSIWFAPETKHQPLPD